jgi:hypothetical protein
MLREQIFIDRLHIKEFTPVLIQKKSSLFTKKCKMAARLHFRDKCSKYFCLEKNSNIKTLNIFVQNIFVRKIF